MNVDRFLSDLRDDPDYAGQIVHIHDDPGRAGRFVPLDQLPSPWLQQVLAKAGIDQVYSHQHQALSLALAGRDVLVSTGTASGKTLCYLLPILQALRDNPRSRALLLFPTKALTQDQFRNCQRLLELAGLDHLLAGVLDGDTPAELRRRLRDRGNLIFSNPDMLHAAVMPQHGRWADFLGNLGHLVIDELHVYSGIFGSNMAHVMTRFARLCDNYGSHPRLTACSATIGNPKELADGLTGRDFALVDQDGSPRGRRVTVFWNPPRIRQRTYRGRRSANVEAHELMARLVAQGVPTITFSKAKMTAEMIHRYVTDRLQQIAPGKAAKVTPYRGGYLPEERREIERRLFSGELLGVSTTPALELGIDVGSLEAAIIVGYPGTRASFFQQAGRAGRKEADSVVFLVGLDTSVNQYIMTEPEYIFGRCVEQAVIDPQNPYVATGHLRCATHEIPLAQRELPRFSPHAETILHVLSDNHKVKQIDTRWYYAASEIPHHEVPLRDYALANVLIEDVDTGNVLGEVNEYDAEPILHPEAIYMHRGDTYRVLELDLERKLARVQKVDVDYYTQPMGGTDIHHVDEQLREKKFGTGKVYWGEVTAYFNTFAYEKIHFYSLDAISRHELELPTLVLETQAFWIVPPEYLMEQVRAAGLDAHSGLRGVGYATRMILPLFLTCDTLDFSHTIGSVNSAWNAIFIYERYPRGLGFTEKAYGRMHEILPAVLEMIRDCPCTEGCPCCVGKPLRKATTWNVERGEASIPSKRAALFILERLLGDRQDLVHEDLGSLTDTSEAREARLERDLRRRLERQREPQVFHPIRPTPEVRTEYPEREAESQLASPDVARRKEQRSGFDRDLRKRLAKKLGLDGLSPHAARGDSAKLTGKPDASVAPRGMSQRGSNLPPTAFPGRPEEPAKPPAEQQPISLGDSLAARARKLKRPRRESSERGREGREGSAGAGDG
jgi:DEAD/DEAH box helicase domain-containing protein